MIARGKRRAERGASPLGPRVNNREALKESNNSEDISHFQCSLQLVFDNQGRRASRLPLAIIFCAVGAAPDWIPTFEAKPQSSALPQNPQSRLDTVSTVRDSGWVVTISFKKH